MWRQSYLLTTTDLLDEIAGEVARVEGGGDEDLRLCAICVNCPFEHSYASSTHVHNVLLEDTVGSLFVVGDLDQYQGMLKQT